jgi:hypothetical protein
LLKDERKRESDVDEKEACLLCDGGNRERAVFGRGQNPRENRRRSEREEL